MCVCVCARARARVRACVPACVSVCMCVCERESSVENITEFRKIVVVFHSNLLDN